MERTNARVIGLLSYDVEFKYLRQIMLTLLIISEQFARFFMNNDIIGPIIVISSRNEIIFCNTIIGVVIL